MFCKHVWKVLEVLEVPSKMEVATQCGLSIKRSDSSVLYKEQKAVLSCSRCGKLRTVSTNNNSL